MLRSSPHPRRLPLSMLLSGLLLVPLWPAAAQAFVQATVESGAHARWYVNEVPYTIDEDAMAAEGIGKKAMQEATLAAFDVWQEVWCELCHDPAGVACPPVPCKAHPLGLTTRFEGFAAKAVMGPGCEGGIQPSDPCAGITAPAPSCKLVPNGNQVIVVRDPKSWCFSSWTVAMTLVSANQVSGEIADADILLNAAHRSFCDGNCGASQYDLKNTLTHEAGHALGLDHSAVAEATMFGGAPPQETIKRDLLHDDEVGICTSYRQAWRSEGCPETEPTGCCAAVGGPANAPTTPLFVLLTAAILCAARRRRDA